MNVSRVAKINYPEISGGGEEEQKKRKKVLKPMKFQKQNTNIKKNNILLGKEAEHCQKL